MNLFKIILLQSGEVCKLQWASCWGLIRILKADKITYQAWLKLCNAYKVAGCVWSVLIYYIRFDFLDQACSILMKFDITDQSKLQSNESTQTDQYPLTKPNFVRPNYNSTTWSERLKKITW